MSHVLTREERETLINISEADSEWAVYTDTDKYKRRLQKFAEEFPQLCRLERRDKETGGVLYKVAKNSLDFKLKKPLSDAQRQSLSERALRHGFAAVSREKVDEIEGL